MQYTPDGGYQGTTYINISEVERLLSLGIGALCVAYGVVRRRPGGWLMTLLGGGLFIRSVTGHSMLYAKIGHNKAVTGLSNKVSVPHHQGVKVEKTLIINRPIEKLYNYWRNLENLPHFMKHLESVTVQDVKHSHWVAKGPAGLHVEWDAEIVNEVPNEVVGWRSLPNADIDNAGSVRFKRATSGHGTEMKVRLTYTPPAGKVGTIIAKLLGEEPEQQVNHDLRRFKNLMEAGEIPTTEGQTSGRKKKIEMRSEKHHESTVLERH